MKKKKVLVLFSGGLDSILSVRILERQNLAVFGLNFKSYFFDGKLAQKAAKELGIFLRTIDFSKDHLEVVKSPRFGYGRNMNPCIDCRILMLRKAKSIFEKEKFSFVATGEVLGERPMSQNRKSLEIVEKESSLTGYLLRPLSAKLLKETIPEKLGLVDRNKLLDIQGRSRKRQLALARELKLKFYPSPSGGCLLTDPEFSRRLKELFQNYPVCDGNDIELLKVGRHIWRDKTKMVIGRNEKENKKIEELTRKGDIIIYLKEYPGPITLIRNYGKNKVSKKIIKEAKNFTQYYSLKARTKKGVKFIIKENKI